VENAVKLPCPKCKNKVTHWDHTEGKMHCPICGNLFPAPADAFKQVVIKSNIPVSKAPDIFAEEREYMKNKLGDLNNHLFEELERLNTPALKGDKLKDEIERARAMTGVAKEIINNGKLTLDAMIAIKEHHIPLPKMLELPDAMP
jgi:DNA-directed RNA polymerase subunit M/transcription elongation factor TFIIS